MEEWLVEFTKKAEFVHVSSFLKAKQDVYYSIRVAHLLAPAENDSREAQREHEDRCQFVAYVISNYSVEGLSFEWIHTGLFREGVEGHAVPICPLILRKISQHFPVPFYNNILAPLVLSFSHLLY